MGKFTEIRLNIEGIADLTDEIKARLFQYAEELDAAHNVELERFKAEWAQENVLIAEAGSCDIDELQKMPYKVIVYEKGTTPPRFIQRG